MRIVIFIDYDNLLESHKTSGVLDVVTRALNQLRFPTGMERGTCEVRVYGGWYEGTEMTTLAQGISAALQQSFPAILRVPNGHGSICTFSVTTALAVTLLEEPGIHLFYHTYRKKGKPSNLRVQKPADVGCINPECSLPLARKLLRTGKCHQQACTVAADDIVYRHEQKTVDTMLACDIVYATQLGFDQLVLVSGDDDFLPPLRTALLRGARIVRIHPKPNGPRTVHIAGHSQLVEIEL